MTRHIPVDQSSDHDEMWDNNTSGVEKCLSKDRLFNRRTSNVSTSQWSSAFGPEEETYPRWCPWHLLLPDHPFTDHLIDCGLYKTGADPLTVPIPFTVIDRASKVPGQLVCIPCDISRSKRQRLGFASMLCTNAKHLLAGGTSSDSSLRKERIFFSAITSNTFAVLLPLAPRHAQTMPHSLPTPSVERRERGQGQAQR